MIASRDGMGMAYCHRRLSNAHGRYRDRRVRRERTFTRQQITAADECVLTLAS
ncbi:MAG: hypothetical protein JWN00_4334 [Actinomycetia bacterium]|nr:hypothetical protein [Actinomycetes bacterium]